MQAAPVHNDVRKKANTYFFSKVAINALLMILGAVLITLFLRQMQNQAALRKQEQNSQQADWWSVTGRI